MPAAENEAVFPFQPILVSGVDDLPHLVCLKRSMKRPAWNDLPEIRSWSPHMVTLYIKDTVSDADSRASMRRTPAIEVTTRAHS